MQNKKWWGVVLALLVVVLMSVSALAAETDLSANYTAASTIYDSAKKIIANSSSRQLEIVKQLDRASTFLASDRRALLSADGFAVPAGAPEALKANRQELADLIEADGYFFTDALKTMTVRIPQNYGMDYGTFNVARSTMQDALSAGFTDMVFQNDFFSVRLSLVEYLPQVPTTVTTLKYFVGETRTDVPQGALDIAKSHRILAFREYRDGVMITDGNYTKNAVSLIADSSFYSMYGYLPSDNLFYKYDATTTTASLVSDYLYSALTKTASFAIEDGNYFLFLPKKNPSAAYEFVGDDYGAYNVQMADNTFAADLFFKDVCAAGSAMVYLVFYDEAGDVTQIKATSVSLQLGQVSVAFELDSMDDINFSLLVWRSSETIQPLFGKVSGVVQTSV